MERDYSQIDGVTRRIEEVRHVLGLNKSDFSQTVGMARQTYQTYVGPVKGRTLPAAPSCILLISVCKAHDVSAEWLLFGRGEIFNEKKASKNV